MLRARHLALAAPGPDAGLAEQMAAAAARAAARGATQDAAELAGQALRLTAAGAGERDGRLLALARYLADAGEYPRVAGLLAGRIGTMPAGPARAAAHLLLGAGADLRGEQEHLAQAIADSAADPGLHAQALAKQAMMLVVNRVQRIADAEQIAGEALAAAGTAGPDAKRRALVALAWARILRGRAIDDLVARSAAVAPGTSSLWDSSVDRPAGVRLVFRGELARAREVFAGLLAAAEQQGEARSGTVAAMQLCEVELRAGDTAAAARALAEVGQWGALEPEVSVFGARAQAMLAALRGDPAQATELAAQVLQGSDAHAQEWDRLEARRAAGLAAAQQHPWGWPPRTAPRPWPGSRPGTTRPPRRSSRGRRPPTGRWASALTLPGRCWSWAAPSGGTRTGPRPGGHWRKPGPGSRRSGARAGHRRRPRSWTGSPAAARRRAAA